MHRLEVYLIAASFSLSAGLLIWKNRQLKLKWQESQQRQAGLGHQGTQVCRRRDALLQQVHSQEEAIRQISQEYDLSKRFLATLDLRQALEITQETLARQMPFLSPVESSAYLARIRSLVEKGEISAQALMDGSPLPPQTDVHSRQQWWNVSGQVALGLRRVGLYRQVQELAIHDGLTGLLVRRHFRERLEEEAARARRRRTPLAFLMIDLDYFKGVNDSFGHLVGDVVLREVSRLIQQSVRQIDLVGRFGGEEFAVALPETDRAMALQVAERVRMGVDSTLIRAYDEEVHVTVSIGVAIFPSDASTAEHLIEKADQAMYQAKATGRNRSVIAQP